MTTDRHIWTAFGGEPITGKVPPRVVVHTDTPGLTMNGAQQAFVAQMYARFGNDIMLSSFPNGHHSRDVVAPDGTKLSMQSINGVHKLTAQISGGAGERFTDSWFYQGYVRHPQSTAGGMRGYIPFTINKAVTRLKPLSPDFILCHGPPYVYDDKYFYSTAATSLINRIHPSVDDPWGGRWPSFVGTTLSTQQLFRDGKLLSAGSVSRTTSVHLRGSDTGKVLVIRNESTHQGMANWFASGYTRTAATVLENFTYWEEGGGEIAGMSPANAFSGEVFDFSGKKIHIYEPTNTWPDRFPLPPMPSWYDPSFLIRALRKGYYHGFVGHGPFRPGGTAILPGGTAAHFYEWGANELNAQTAVAHDAAGRTRPVIFCPLETPSRGIISLNPMIFSRLGAWGAVAAYDQVLHGWRANSTAAHTLALTGTKVGAAHHMTTIESLLQGAGIDPALAAHVFITDLNMVSTDQNEPPIF